MHKHNRYKHIKTTHASEYVRQAKAADAHASTNHYTPLPGPLDGSKRYRMINKLKSKKRWLWIPFTFFLIKGLIWLWLFYAWFHVS